MSEMVERQKQRVDTDHLERRSNQMAPEFTEHQRQQWPGSATLASARNAEIDAPAPPSEE